MKVLRSNIEYFRGLGLYFAPGQNRTTITNIVFNVLLTLSICLILAGTWAYFFVNLKEIVKMTFGLYAASAVTIIYAGYWQFALRKHKFMAIIDELQAIVASSKFA